MGMYEVISVTLDSYAFCLTQLGSRQITYNLFCCILLDYHFRRNVSNIKSTGSIGKNVHLVAKQFSKKYISGLSREIFILSCIQFGNKIESFKDFDLKSSMWGDYRTEMMARHVDKMPNEVCRLIGICVILSYFFWQRTPCAEQLYYTFKN